MTIKERIEADGVEMKWLRTAATTISSITAALFIIWGGIVWLVEPRFYEWAGELVDKSTESIANDVNRTSTQLDKLEDVVVALQETVKLLSETTAINTQPSWRFDPVETTISDGQIGGEVRIEAAGFKVRDCGVPLVDLYYADSMGVYHRFENASLLSETGRGIALPVDPSRMQRVGYTAIIPDDGTTSLGRAQGFISLVYPDKCPNLDPAIAGPLQFRISPKGE